MKPATETWIRVAEIDFDTATLAADAPRPILESICFHSQQCVEKYLKAILEEADRPIPRVHDLSRLLTLVEDLVPELIGLRVELDVLVPYASILRYPHDPIERDELTETAEAAFATMIRVRQFVRAYLENDPEEIEPETNPST